VTGSNNVDLKTGAMSNSPPCKVADRYVNQEGHPIVTDTPSAVRSRVQCGTTAGHMPSGVRTRTPEQASDLGFLSWGGQDLNLRPTDYESAALTD
jgi:lysozyme family protein